MGLPHQLPSTQFAAVDPAGVGFTTHWLYPPITSPLTQGTYPLPLQFIHPSGLIDFFNPTHMYTWIHAICHFFPSLVYFSSRFVVSTLPLALTFLFFSPEVKIGGKSLKLLISIVDFNCSITALIGIIIYIFYRSAYDFFFCILFNPTNYNNNKCLFSRNFNFLALSLATREKGWYVSERGE